MKTLVMQSERFLCSIFTFTDEEDAAMHKQIPMTKEILYSCMDKFIKTSQIPEQLYIDFINAFPKLANKYVGELLQEMSKKN